MGVLLFLLSSILNIVLLIAINFFQIKFRNYTICVSMAWLRVLYEEYHVHLQFLQLFDKQQFLSIIH